MRRLVIPLMLSVALCSVVQPLTAQVNLADERTPEQKWTRMMYMGTFMYTGFLAYAKEQGQTAEQAGTWFGKIASAGWPSAGGMSLTAYVRQTFLNNNLWPGLEFEILTETEDEITCRMNQPWKSYFEDDGEWYGVTVDEYMAAWIAGGKAISAHVGFDQTHEVQGDWVLMTWKTMK